MILTLAVCVLSGCDTEPKVTKYPVSGTVSLDGKPIESGLIQFNNPADGGIDVMDIKDGKFAGEVRAGKRRVEITAMRDGGEGPMPGIKIQENYIPEKYNRQTTLEEEVKEGPNEFTFELKS